MNSTLYQTDQSKKNRSAARNLAIIIPVASVLYLLFSKYTTGIRSDHIFLVTVVNACYFISSFTRRLIVALGIIIIYWMIYDSMKAWPNWAFHHVNIEPLYELEKKLFGIHLQGIALTPNEFLIRHQSTFVDILCGIFYLSWVPLPLIFAIFLFFKNKILFLRFCMAFFIVNLIGFIIYYLHPAAPPWYYAEFGPVLDVNTKGNAAGLLRVDNYFEIDLFKGIYSKGSNVFAAMPSLHASYPLIGFVYALKHHSKFFKIIFFTFMIGIWFAAVYLNHHYILDIIAGILCGIAGILLLEKILLLKRGFRFFMKRYEEFISA